MGAKNASLSGTAQSPLFVMHVWFIGLKGSPGEIAG